MKTISFLNTMLETGQMAIEEIRHEFDVEHPYFVPPHVGGVQEITAPDPNNYGREIVIGKIKQRGCPYCGNTSGLKDSRGGCVSCGGDLSV